MSNNTIPGADFWDFTGDFPLLPPPKKLHWALRYFFSIKVVSIFFIISHIFIYLLITFYIIFSTNLFNISVTFSLRLDLFKFHEFQYSQCGIRKIQQRNFVFHENSHSILISFCWRFFKRKIDNAGQPHEPINHKTMNKLWGKYYNFLANWLIFNHVIMLHKNK